MASILEAGSERIVRLLLQNNEVNEFNPAEKARAKGKQHISERWFKHIFNHAEIRGQIAEGYYCIVEDEKINHLRVDSKGGSYHLEKGITLLSLFLEMSTRKPSTREFSGER